MFIKREENPSTDCFQALSSDHGPQEGSAATAPSTSPVKNEHATDTKSADQPQIADTSTPTQEHIPMSLPLQDDLCLTAMEATIQSVFDALNVLSQQQQHTPHSAPPPASSEVSGLQASSSPTNTSAATASAILAQISLPSSTIVPHSVSTVMSSSPTVGKNDINSSLGNAYPVVTHQPAVPETPELSPAELLKQQMMKQKVRSDNRERKQRWRINNEERNKDNDLRCRVNKRAQKLFGMEPSDHKRKWVDEEFERRRAKRQEKERRKQAVNGALAATTPTTSTPTTTTEEISDPATISQLQHKLLQHYQSLFGMDQQDSEKTKNSTAALVAALQNPQLLQLSQLLAQTVTAGSVPPPPQPLSPQQQHHHHHHQHHQPSPTSASASSSSSLPPQPPLSSTTAPPSTTSLITAPDDPAFLSLQHPPLADGATTKNDDDNQETRMDLDQSKIDLAAAEIMKQFTSHALGTAAPLEAVESSTTTDSTTEETTTATTTTTEKKNDYPMDAVMTLMELNAGWRP